MRCKTSFRIKVLTTEDRSQWQAPTAEELNLSTDRGGAIWSHWAMCGWMWMWMWTGNRNGLGLVLEDHPPGSCGECRVGAIIATIGLSTSSGACGVNKSKNTLLRNWGQRNNTYGQIPSPVLILIHDATIRILQRYSLEANNTPSAGHLESDCNLGKAREWRWERWWSILVKKRWERLRVWWGRRSFVHYSLTWVFCNNTKAVPYYNSAACKHYPEDLHIC